MLLPVQSDNQSKEIINRFLSYRGGKVFVVTFHMDDDSKDIVGSDQSSHPTGIDEEISDQTPTRGNSRSTTPTPAHHEDPERKAVLTELNRLGVPFERLINMESEEAKKELESIKKEV